MNAARRSSELAKAQDVRGTVCARAARTMIGWLTVLALGRCRPAACRLYRSTAGRRTTGVTEPVWLWAWLHSAVGIQLPL